MRFTVFKKLILSLMLSVSVLTIYSDAQNITSDKYDLDLNGTKEWVKLYVDRIDKDISIPSYMEIRYNIPTDIVSNIYDGIDIPNEKGLLCYYKMKVIDINPDDKQKEIMLMLSATDYFYNEIQLYSLVNGKILFVGKVEGVSDIDNVAVNKKTKRLEVMSETYYPMQSSYYRKFMIVDGKLKEVTNDEVNLSYFNEKIILTAQKSIDAYSNSNFNKKSFLIKPSEKISFVSANEKLGYIKVKNSQGKIGYIQTKKSADEYRYALKQYPNVYIEGEDKSPFTGAHHWN